MAVVNFCKNSSEQQVAPRQHLANILNMGISLVESARILMEIPKDTELPNEQPSSLYNTSDRPKTLLQVAQLQYKMRRKRDILFDSFDIFGEPAWDILLDLFISKQIACTVSVTSVCFASSVPTTTALRWIKHLEDLELVTRKCDSKDRRRTFIILSAKGEKLMTDYLSYHVQNT